MDITLDLDIYRWTLEERIAFEGATGMTCERAMSLLEKAGRDADAALDVPAAVSAALVWIVAKREEPKMTFAQAAAQFTGQDFLDAIPGGDEDEDDPLGGKAPKPTSTKSSARSAGTSSTRPRKSAN